MRLTTHITHRRVLPGTLLSVLLLLTLSWLVSGCKDDDDFSPNMDLSTHTIMIDHIIGIPKEVTFDKVAAKITGNCWEVIGTVSAPYTYGSATLTLPATFPAEMLQAVDRSIGMCGHWDAKCDNSDALVAGLGDILAYNDGKVVGMIRLTDWSGKDSSAGKAFVYYHYADSPFELSGRNATYYYSAAAFKEGWNAYANIRPSNDELTGNNKCTTDLSDTTELRWHFVSQVY